MSRANEFSMRCGLRKLVCVHSCSDGRVVPEQNQRAMADASTLIVVCAVCGSLVIIALVVLSCKLLHREKDHR